MRVSIRQVAEIAQVSPATVTRVLRGGGAGLVSAQARERVLDAVRQTNYVPVRAAAFQNRHVRTHILGVVPYHENVSRNRIDSETYGGISRAARAQGYDLLILLRGEEEWMAGRAEARFLDRRSDGFLFVSTGRGEWQGVLEALVRQEVPSVVCYRRDVPEGVAWVDPDNETIVRLAVDALVRRGHTQIAYLATPGYDLTDQGHLARQPITGGNYDDFARRGAFLERMRELHGSDQPERIITSRRPDWELDREILEVIRQRGITGVVCMNDLIAGRLWRLARAAGWRIPEDLSITGVDDTVEAEQLGLTSIAFSYEEVGARAVGAWVRLASGEAAADCCTVVPVTLKERNSIAQPA